MLHPIAHRSDDHHTDTEILQVLLELDSLICGEKDGEPGLSCLTQKAAVLETTPALLLDGRAFVPGKLANQGPGKRLVYEDSHAVSRT